MAYLIGDHGGVAVAKGAQLGALSLADFGRQYETLRLARMGVESARRLWGEFAAESPADARLVTEYDAATRAERQDAARHVDRLLAKSERRGGARGYDPRAVPLLPGHPEFEAFARDEERSAAKAGKHARKRAKRPAAAPADVRPGAPDRHRPRVRASHARQVQAPPPGRGARQPPQQPTAPAPGSRARLPSTRPFRSTSDMRRPRTSVAALVSGPARARGGDGHAPGDRRAAVSKGSRRARIEARAEEIAVALAQAGAPAHLTKGASFAPLLAAEQFLPAAPSARARAARYVITAESKTQLTAFALRPDVLRSLAAQANRAVRELDASAEAGGGGPSQEAR